MKYRISPTHCLLELIEKQKQFFSDRLLYKPDTELNLELFADSSRPTENGKHARLAWSLLESQRALTLSSDYPKHKRLFNFAYTIIDSNGQITPELTSQIADDLAVFFFAKENNCIYDPYNYIKQIFANCINQFEPYENKDKGSCNLIKVSNFLFVEFVGDFNFGSNTLKKITLTFDATLTNKERAAIFTQRDYSEPKDQTLLCEQLLQLAKLMGVPPQPINNNLR